MHESSWRCRAVRRYPLASEIEISFPAEAKAYSLCVIGGAPSIADIGVWTPLEMPDKIASQQSGAK